jgi:hypothetical protein
MDFLKNGVDLFFEKILRVNFDELKKKKKKKKCKSSNKINLNYNIFLFNIIHYN